MGKTLEFTAAQGAEFALLYARLMEGHPVQTQQLGMFGRIQRALEAVSTGNEDLVNRVVAQIQAGDGKELISGILINRRMCLPANGTPVTVELQDEDFAFLDKRIREQGWSPLTVVTGESLLGILDRAAKPPVTN